MSSRADCRFCDEESVGGRGELGCRTVRWGCGDWMRVVARKGCEGNEAAGQAW